ncbi:MAG TPA: hypothetical protein VHY91_02790 [Pirellulales bacterium]|jgi:hypothetical protein|nr:hypothetical protein [Pirellulales bacterium]
MASSNGRSRSAMVVNIFLMMVIFGGYGLSKPHAPGPHFYYNSLQIAFIVIGAAGAVYFQFYARGRNQCRSNLA